jgi:hypothetical protein
MQVALSQMNAAFGPDSVDAHDPALFALVSGESLADVLGRANIGLDDATLDYISKWPSVLQASLHAAISANLAREGTVPITFAWMPGYDYEMTIVDIRDTSETHGGITVLLKSRYPDDTHPLERTSS